MMSFFGKGYFKKKNVKQENANPSATTITSVKFFEYNWKVWKLLGVTLPKFRTNENDHFERRRRGTYLLWAIVVHAVATLSFPIHLGLGIFESTNQSMLFEAISITVTSIGASFKNICFITKMEKVRKMERILQELDERIVAENEKQYFREILTKHVSQVQNMFTYLYLTVGIGASISFLISKERRLFYSGGFPLDWRHSLWSYALALCYQFLGIFMQFMQNYTNDSFPPKAMCVLSGHIQLLSLRISKIGHSEEAQPRRDINSLHEQEKELIQCVKDQKNLYDLFDVVQDIISWPMFLQIFVSIANSCVALAALLFFVTDLVPRIYYMSYILGVAMQIFPTCYYGSDVAILFEELHYAIFSTNWTDQTKSYKRNMMIFTERTLKNNTALAGNMFPIHLDTFFAACKGAYSLFAVIMTMK